MKSRWMAAKRMLAITTWWQPDFLRIPYEMCLTFDSMSTIFISYFSLEKFNKLCTPHHIENHLRLCQSMDANGRRWPLNTWNVQRTRGTKKSKESSTEFASNSKFAQYIFQIDLLRRTRCHSTLYVKRPCAHHNTTSAIFFLAELLLFVISPFAKKKKNTEIWSD